MCPFDGIKNQKPWLDRRGNVLSDEEIRRVSKTWTPEIWDGYLKFFEIYQREALFEKYERVEQLESARFAQERRYLNADSELVVFASANDLRNYVRKLTYRQRQFVELVYYQGKSLQEAADTLGISERALLYLKSRTLKRLHDLLKNRMNNGRLVSQVGAISGGEYGSH